MTVSVRPYHRFYYKIVVKNLVLLFPPSPMEVDLPLFLPTSVSFAEGGEGSSINWRLRSCLERCLPPLGSIFLLARWERFVSVRILDQDGCFSEYHDLRLPAKRANSPREAGNEPYHISWLQGRAPSQVLFGASLFQLRLQHCLQVCHHLFVLNDIRSLQKLLHQGKCLRQKLLFLDLKEEEIRDISVENSARVSWF